jgi:molybdopterin molybdotransferase
MISVDEARVRMLARVERLGAEQVDLELVGGRTLGAPVRAARDQPPFDAAIMDGYAFRSADTPGDLRIVGESAAGHRFDRILEAGEAVRISTGAPLPAAADAVLAQEDARVAGATLTAPATKAGAFVRPRGGDFRNGDLLVEDGRVIDAGAIAAIAGVGLRHVPVTRKPVIAIIANGDELVSPGDLPREDQVYDSATFAVAALARAWGGEVRRRAPVRDTQDGVTDAVVSGLSECDVLVIVGGASVGPHDHVRPALRALGAEMIVEGVNVRPGRPTWFAQMPGGRSVLGLPGNPASALVCARLFLAPVLETMLSGSQQLSSRTFEATLSTALAPNGARESYIRAIARKREVTPIPDEDSSLMSVLAQSNCLIQRTPHASKAAASEQVLCVLWTT